MKRFILAFFVICSFYGARAANTIYVNDATFISADWCSAAGNDFTGNGSSSAPYATLAKAISVAAVGDFIKVDAGLYLNESALVVNVAGLNIVGHGTSATVFQLTSGTTNFMTITANNVEVWDMTVKGYNSNTALTGKAFTITNAFDVDLHGVFIQNSLSASGGEASVYISTTSNKSSLVTITRCSFIGNIGNYGGGIDICSNTPTGGVTNTVTIDSCYFENNGKYLFNGGALLIYNGSSASASTKSPLVTVTNSKFGNACTGNQAMRGGAIYVDNGAGLTVRDNCFMNNSAIDVAGPDGGGAVWMGYSFSSFTDCKFESNTANTGTAKNGGAFYVSSSSSSIGNLLIDRCAFINNNGNKGGGLYVGKVNQNVFNSLFYGNTSTGAGANGGGMAINNASASVTLYNCTFSKNTTTGSLRGDGIDANSGNFTSFDLKNSILYGNGSQKELAGGTNVNVSWSTIGVSSVAGVDYTSVTGNTTANPLFTNPSGNDFTLSGTSSPAYNTGNSDGGNAPTVDINSLPRPQYDMGCYALNSSPVLKWTCPNNASIATIATTSLTTCPGQTVGLSALPSSGYLYSWSSIPGGLSATTQSVVVSPSSTTVYQVQLTDLTGNCGTYGTALFTLALGPGPLPVVKPDFDSICSGQSINVVASGANTYTWTVSQGNINPTTGSAITYTAPLTSSGTTATFSVVGTDNLGCTSTVPGVATVTINPIPTLTLTPSTNNICSASSANFYAAGADTYTWSVSGGSLNTSGGDTVIYTAPSVTAATTVTVTVSGTASLRCNSLPVTFTVVVNPYPTVSVNPTSAVICSGVSTTLTASGASTYTWSAGTGSFNNVNANPVVYTAPSVTGTATENLSLIGTSAAGCSDTLFTAVTLTVNPQPSLTFTANPATLCAATTTTLNASGALSYTWSAPGGSFNNIHGNPVFYTTPSVTTATLVPVILNGTNSFGCLNVIPDTVYISLNPVPAITTTATAGSICSAGTATINASGANSYTWTTSGGSINTTSGTTVVFTAPSVTTTTNFTVGVNGTGANTCSTGSAINTIITVNAPPVIASTYSNSAVCEGSVLTFTAAGASTYTWSASSGSFSSLNGNATSYLPPVTGGIPLTVTVSVVGTNSIGCASAGATTFTFVVDPIPVISAVGTPTAVCSGATTTLSATGANTYTWSSVSGSFNNANSSTSVYTTPAVTVATTVTVTVTGTSAAGCLSPVADTVLIDVDAMPVLSTNTNTLSLCSGNTATLSVSGATTYSWSTTFGTLSPSSGTAVTYTAPAGSGNATVTVNGSTNAGCMAAPSIITVTVNPIPSINAIANNTVICSGTTTTLTASGATTYTWSSTLGTFSSVNANPVVYTAPVTSASNTITVNVSGTSSAGCISNTSGTVAVAVNAEPPTSIVTQPAQLCSGNSTTIVSSGAPTYSWSASTGTVTPNSGNIVTYQSPTVSAVTIATVSVVGNNGTCPNSVPIITTVTVNPITTPTITLSGPAALCTGDSVVLTCNPSTGILWNTGATTPSITVHASGSFTVIATNSYGCSAPSSVVTTTMFPLSTAPVITASGPVSFCQEDSLELSVNHSNGVTWLPGMQTNDSIYVHTTGTYTVTYTDANNCPSAPAYITVNTFNDPVINYTNLIVTPAHCDLNNGSVTGITVSGSGPFTYVWRDSTGAVIGGNGASLSNIAGGSYSVQVTDLNGCKSVSNVAMVPNLPGIQVVLSASPLSGTAPATFNFNAQTAVNNPSGGYSWTYGTGTGNSTVSNQSQYVYGAAGLYNVVVMVTDSFGCVAKDTIQVVVLENESVIVPNVFTPNNDGINDAFTITSSGVSDIHIWIYDRWGKLMYEKADGNIYWEGTNKNNTDCVDGTYYYILEYKGQKGDKKNSKGYISLVR